MNRGSIPAALALYGFLFVPPACGEAWTNQAGHAIHAELTEFKDGVVSLRTTNGVTLRMPIGALCAGAQEKVRQRHGMPDVPAFVRAAYRDARAVLKRYDCLPEKQKSPEAQRKAVSMALAVFDRRVTSENMANLAEDVRQETSRLRRKLAR